MMVEPGDIGIYNGKLYQFRGISADDEKIVYGWEPIHELNDKYSLSYTLTVIKPLQEQQG